MGNFRYAVNFKNLNSSESIRCNHSFGSEFQTPVDFNRSQKAKCTFLIWSTPNKHIHSFIWAFVFVVVSPMDIRKYLFFLFIYLNEAIANEWTTMQNEMKREKKTVGQFYYYFHLWLDRLVFVGLRPQKRKLSQSIHQTFGLPTSENGIWFLLCAKR